MGIVASSSHGALPLPTPLTFNLCFHLLYVVLCPCRSASNENSRSVLQPMMCVRDVSTCDPSMSAWLGSR
eukprot:6146645-Lingulodinium_polyedra.AAC.1